jgi:hypothetical protein
MSSFPNVSFHFDSVHTPITTIIGDRLRRANKIRIVSGFMTRGGIDELSSLYANHSALETLVVGAGTYSAFEALDYLISKGTSPKSLFVHNGFSKTTTSRKYLFARFRPMLHSKIFYMEFDDGSCCAFVGSHNLTSFALGGANGEAGLLIEGSQSLEIFKEINAHIDTAKNEAVQYNPIYKGAYAWWLRTFINGLGPEVGGPPSNWQSGRIILVFAQAAPSIKLQTGEMIYFEIPSNVEKIKQLETEIHLFIFDILPPAKECYQRINEAHSKYLCLLEGADRTGGNKVVEVDWRIDSRKNGILYPVFGRQYITNTAEQQIRAKIISYDTRSIDYHFSRPDTEWEPILSEDIILKPQGLSEFTAKNEFLGDQRSHDQWRLVRGFKSKESELALEMADIREMSPGADSYFIIALGKSR